MISGLPDQSPTLSFLTSIHKKELESCKTLLIVLVGKFRYDNTMFGFHYWNTSLLSNVLRLFLAKKKSIWILAFKVF